MPYASRSGRRRRCLSRQPSASRAPRPAGDGVSIVEERLQGEPHAALRDQPGGRLVEELAVSIDFTPASIARRIARGVSGMHHHYVPQSSAASTAARQLLARVLGDVERIEAR